MRQKRLYKVTFYLDWDIPKFPERYFSVCDIEKALVLANKYKCKWDDATVQSIKYVGKTRN